MKNREMPPAFVPQSRDYGAAGDFARHDNNHETAWIRGRTVDFNRALALLKTTASPTLARAQ
jgi:hypothetical protein